MKKTAVARLLTAVLLAACATGGSVGGASAPSRNRDLITSAELAKENSPTVYDAIEHLRPEMLRPRPGNSSSSLASSSDYTVHVYMDNNRLGEIAELRAVPLAAVKEIRYLDPNQAMQRFGSGNPRRCRTPTRPPEVAAACR
jgi:hypothetical protein